MKKLLSILLVLCMLSSFVTFTVLAEEENFIPESDSTFESGNHTWKTLGSGGLLKVVDNPTGEGKVLCYSGIPDQSFASPQIDVREYITKNISEETTLYGSMDIYTKSDDLANVLIRIRTKTADGFSMCAADGKNYCSLGKVNVYAGEWTRVTFTFDVAEQDFSSTENWDICFDGLSRSTKEAIYIDNFYIGTEEESPLEENEDNGETNTPVAEGEAVNFLSENASTFESGNTSWSVLGGGTVSVVDNPSGEGKVLCYSDIDLEKSYASPRLDIRGAIQKNVDEEVTIYGSMDIYCEKDLSNRLIRLRTTTPEGFSMCAADDKPYCAIGAMGAPAGEWTTVNFSFEIFEEDLESQEPWHLCFDNTAKDLEADDKIYIDNVYIGLVEREEAGIEKKPIPEKTPVSRFEKTLVGTIRWDAFTKSTPDGMDPASQVARVLSPAKYHCQAPFFSIVNEDGTISFPEYTVETWEKEAEYAVAGGLDYFAYLWYETTDAMSQPRKLHLQSEKKDTIKMCGILESPRSKKSMDELYTAMKDSCYLSLDGRPVLFIYGIGGKDSKWKKSDIDKLRQDAANAGVEGSLYIVGMCFTENLSTFADVVAKGVDAISWYGVSALKTGEPFSVLATRTETTMVKMGGYALGNNIDIIPAFSAGRDTRARIETGVTWVDGDPNAENDADKPYHNWYTLEPSMDEFQAHIEAVLTYASTQPNAKTNIVCSYGWNEHEEGGWLCPTIMVDENGNPIYNEDGTIKVNTERLDALKAAKEKVLNTAVSTDDTTATPTPSEAPQGQGNNSGFNPLFIIIPAVIVIGAVVVGVVVTKKKKED